MDKTTIGCLKEKGKAQATVEKADFRGQNLTSCDTHSVAPLMGHFRPSEFSGITWSPTALRWVCRCWVHSCVRGCAWRYEGIWVGICITLLSMVYALEGRGMGGIMISNHSHTIGHTQNKQKKKLWGLRESCNLKSAQSSCTLCCIVNQCSSSQIAGSISVLGAAS